MVDVADKTSKLDSEKQGKTGGLSLEEMRASGNPRIRDLYGFIHSKGTLFRKISGYVENKIGGSYSVTEEIMGEVLASACLNRGSYDPDQNLFTWLHTIACRKCIDYQRKQRVRKPISTIRFEIDPTDLSYQSPLDVMIEDEERIAVNKLIAKLPGKRTRQIFKLIAIDGLRNHEVANKLGIASGTVKSMYYRSRMLLRKMIEDPQYSA